MLNMVISVLFCCNLPVIEAIILLMLWFKKVHVLNITVSLIVRLWSLDWIGEFERKLARGGGQSAIRRIVEEVVVLG